MLHWIRGLFYRNAPPPQPAPTRRRRPPPAPLFRMASPLPMAETPPPEAEPETEPAPPDVPPELLEQAAERVLLHFREHRPGPGSFPGTASRIIAVVQAPDVDLNRLVQVVGQDVAIAAKLLQVANSAFNARGGPIQGVREAVLRLGVREVAEIAVAVAGKSLFETASRAEYALFPHLWEATFHDSMSLAFSSSWLAMFAGRSRSDQAFLAGMLHDIGRPLALRSLAALLLASELDNRVLVGVSQVVDRVHVEIGASLTAAWALPDYVRLAAVRHHEDVVPDEPALADVHLVRVMDGVKAMRDGSITGAVRRTLRQSAAILGLDDRKMMLCAREFAELAGRVTELFGVADPVKRARPGR